MDALAGRCALLATAVAAIAVAGCGAGTRDDPPRATATAAARAAATPAHHAARAVYVPSAHHRHRVAHAVFNDEIGENIVGLETPYSRIVQLFGPPLERRPAGRGFCVFYRVVGAGDEGWRFCFTRGRMSSATGSLPLRDF